MFLPLAGLLAELDYRAPARTYAFAIIVVAARLIRPSHRVKEQIQ